MEFTINPSGRAWSIAGAFLVWFGSIAAVLAQSTNNPAFAARVENAYRQAQIRFQSTTNNDAAWQFARACFDFADIATNESKRAAIAREGISACDSLLAHDTNSAPGHYYLAMNFGKLAQAEAPSMAALKLIRQIEREFKAAAESDSALDYAGPARGLGLLYRDAPGWPVSIGSRRKARDWLEKAAKLAPDYPENQLNLAESFLQWNDDDTAKNSLQTLDTLWPKAQARFPGEDWSQSWQDWSARREVLRRKLGEPAEPLIPKKRGP
jgi:hypothetical protein